MSDGEDFLSRWSRRKRAATESMGPSEDASDRPVVSPSSGEVSVAPDETGGATETSEKEEFDLASLPPIDSIVEGTDVSAFLKQGVPLDLTRAALRRAWSTDPAIRDFIGLAENAWDFNDPNAMPGFGPLDQSPEEVRRMLAQVMGEVRQGAEEALLNDAAASRALPPKHSDSMGETNAVDDPPTELPAAGTEADPQFDSTDPACVRHEADIVMQHPEDNTVHPMVRRTHGGALPR